MGGGLAGVGGGGVWVLRTAGIAGVQGAHWMLGFPVGGALPVSLLVFLPPPLSLSFPFAPWSLSPPSYVSYNKFCPSYARIEGIRTLVGGGGRGFVG